MGVETIVRALDSFGVSEVDLELADRDVHMRNHVVFRVFYSLNGERKCLDHSISAPRNAPYTITGRESKQYRAAWDALNERFGDPLKMLGPHLERVYSVNIPNATHLIAGFAESYEEFRQLAQGRIRVMTIGDLSHDDDMVELVRMVDGFYAGYTIGDIPERFQF